jgi:hypothetical protein
MRWVARTMVLQKGVLVSSATDMLPEGDGRKMCVRVRNRKEDRVVAFNFMEGTESGSCYNYRLLTPLPDVAEEMELELLGGLSVKSIPTSRDCNIRRIGSRQSRIRFPVAEVICVAVTVSDGLFRSGKSAG